MNEAKITIRVKDVIGTLGMAQHPYLIFTDSKGKEYIIRGGPSDNNFFTGNLEIFYGEYGNWNGHLHRDWDDKGAHIHLPPIWQGSDAEMWKLYSKATKIGDKINDLKADYKLPGGKTFAATIDVMSTGDTADDVVDPASLGKDICGASPSMCSSQNSGSAVNTIINGMGLTHNIPKVYEDGGKKKVINVPGLDDRIMSYKDSSRTKFTAMSDSGGPPGQGDCQDGDCYVDEEATGGGFLSNIGFGWLVGNAAVSSGFGRNRRKDGGQDEGDGGPRGDGPGGGGDGGSGSGGGSWYNPFSWSFSSKPTLYQQQHDLINRYKPLYLQQPLFQLPNPLHNHHFISDPLWLYGSKSTIGDDMFKEWQIRQDFRQSVKSCLENSFCTDTVSSLVQQAMHRVSDASDLKIFYSLQSKLASDAMTEAASVSSLLAVSRKGFTIGGWSHPLREELKYAASHVSPLVFDLNGDGIKLFPYTNGVYFDIDNDGYLEKVGWASPEDGQLALDLNGNGKIDDITELFGDDLISAFFKLSLFDSNNDKVIDAKDDDFSKLLIWRDKNVNGYTDAGELSSLKELGIKDISLTTKPDNRVIEGNTITETAEFTYEDGSKGEVADVHYHNDDMDSWFKGNTPSYGNSDKYKEAREKFRVDVLRKLAEKVKNPKDIDQNGDWIAELIKEEVARYVGDHNALQEEELHSGHKKVNKVVSTKIAASRLACASESLQISADANERYAAKKRAVDQELLKEAQSKLDQEKEDVNARYTQEFVAAKEKLLADINEELKQANANTLQAAMHNSWGQEYYYKAVEANKERLGKQFEEKTEELRKQYGELASQEIAKLVTKYQGEYQQKIDEFVESFKSEENTQLDQKQHNHGQACDNKLTGIKSVLQDQFTKFQLSNDHVKQEFIRNVQEEAESVYKFFTSKVMKVRENVEKPFEDSEGWQDDKYFAKQEEENSDKSEDNSDKSEEESRGQKSGSSRSEEKSSTREESSDKSEDNSGVKIDPETLLMPLMRGYGNIPALHIAASYNAKLKSLVMDFMELSPRDLGNIHDKVVAILYEWAGVSGIPEDARAAAGGANIEARKVAFVEQVTGQEFKQLGAANFVGQHASTAVQKAWDIALVRMTKNLLVQGPLISLFPNAEYSFADDDAYLNSNLSEILGKANEFAGAHSLDYNFWVLLGYILASSTKELGVEVSEIRAKLSVLAGEEIMLDSNIFGLIGDQGDNVIKGTSGSDYIKGLGGNDKLYGKAGSDHMEGDEGDDELYGDAGIDRMHGGSGHDKMYGGDERDFMYGGEGDDTMHGEKGDDHIEGGDGADEMDGGEGENTLSYGDSPEGVYVNLKTAESRNGHANGDKFKNFQNLGGSEFNDHMVGDDKDNYMNGEGGDDDLHGEGGDDNLFGATGEDKLHGGDGDDFLTGFEGADHMDGGEGKDTANYHHPYATKGVRVELAEGRGVGGHANGDTYRNIENVKGSRFNDIIHGDNSSNVLEGMEGDDTLNGEEGNNVLIGGPGQDKVFAGNGNNTIVLTGDGDQVKAGTGINTVSYRYSTKPVTLNMTAGIGKTNLIHEDRFENIQNAYGSEFDDEMHGDAQDNTILGGAGSDTINAGRGDDIIKGGEGNDVLNGQEGDDRFIGDEGADEIDGGLDKDTVDYSSEDNEGVQINLETARGKGGNAEGDRLKNIESVVGTKFNDLLIGNKYNNYLFGNDGDDELRGREGNDQLSGGKGKNVLDGGSGLDFASYFWSLSGVNISLASGGSSKVGEYEDTYIDIEGIIGSRFSDYLVGHDNNNYLFGNDGDDYIQGGTWNDRISGGRGNNILEGKRGRDEFLVDEGSNTIDGGDGEDTVNYGGYNQEHYQDKYTREFEIRLMPNILPGYPGQRFPSDLVVLKVIGFKINLNSSQTFKDGGLTDKLINIEHVTGTRFDDVIIGDDNDNHLNGNDGHDEIHGGGGQDVITFGLGNSILFGDEGDDLFVAKGFPADIDGGDGFDAVDLQFLQAPINISLVARYIIYDIKFTAMRSRLINTENIRSTQFNDILYDDNGSNAIAAGAGNDEIHLSGGDDYLNAELGRDIVYLEGGGTKRLWGGGGIGPDIYVITSGFESHNKTSTIVVDFDAIAPCDKIDLTAYQHLNTIKDLYVEQLTDNGNNFTTITIAPNKYISLYNVNATILSECNFLFNKPQGEKIEAALEDL